jgi:hypothetical protein
MTRQHVLPALDCQAHIAPDVNAQQLASVGDAHMFAMTRSLAEATAVLRRRDPALTWGIGVHPGVAEARSTYDPDRFRALLPSFALVGEVGWTGWRNAMNRRASSLMSSTHVASDRFSSPCTPPDGRPMS